MDVQPVLDGLRKIAQDPPKDEQSKKQLYDAARRAMFATESPQDLLHRVYFSQLLITITKVATDIGIFKTLAGHDGVGCTVEQLAQETKADPRLILRIIRGLVVHDLVRDTGRGTFAANEATKMFSHELIIDGVDHNQMNVGPCFQHLPDFLSKTEYKDPTGASIVPFHVAFNTDMNPFLWLANQPARAKAVTGTMAAQRAGQKVWFADPHLFPAEDFSLTAADVDKGRVLMVDVGGGAGQQCVALRKAQPKLPGRVVLQDLAYAAEGLPSSELKSLEIEAQTYDFFTPQPIQGAKVYYFRTVLHDWPDDKCIAILKNIRQAMAPDSVLIVDEMVVRDTLLSVKQVNYDITMMVAVGAMERTRSEWEELLSKVGIKIKEVREHDPDSGESIILAVPA